jgi:hypothetical protein
MAFRGMGTESFLRPRFYIAAVLTAFVAVFLWGSGAWADSPDRCAAKRDDAQIKKLVGQLEQKLAEKTGLDKEPAVVLYGDRHFDSTDQSHLALHNIVLKINDPGNELAHKRTFGYRDDADIEYLGGWIWRDDKVIRLEESSWHIDRTGGQSPQDVVFTFPDLKKGDVVCCSVQAKNNFPYMGSYLRMSCELPVMLCNTRVKTGGHFSLAFLGHNMVPKKNAQKVFDEKDGYPIDVKYTVVDIPPNLTGSGAPLFYEYQPYLLVYPKAQFNPMTEAWMEAKSWNLVAMYASGYQTSIQEKSAVVAGKARELTAGLATDAEKTDALYEFIQNDIKLVCFFDDFNSSKLEDILAHRQASRRGKSTLMYAMCHALGLPVDVLLSRDRQLGQIDRTACTIDQFTDYIIVLNGDIKRYYVPTTGPCQPGELPPGLKGMNAFAAKSDLKEPFRQVAIEAMSRSSGNPASSSAIFNSLLDQQDWSEWILLP